MSFQRQSRSTKRFTLGRQTFVLHPITFCIMSFALLFSTTTPSLSASDGWAATYGGTDTDKANSIQQTGDGGYVVTGWAGSFGTERALWVLKLKPDGLVEWQKTYGGIYDEAHSIQQTHDGGYIVAGWTLSLGAGPGDLWVLKLRPDGTPEWQVTYGGGDDDVALSIQQTGDGGYIVGGGAMSFGDILADSWVLKLRPDGNPEWQKTYGGGDLDRADSIQQTGDGGYIVVCDTISFGAGGPDIWVLKLRPDGSVGWERTYGGKNYDRAYSIQQTSDSGYIVAGETRSFGARGGDAWVFKLRPDGTLEWQKTYGGAKPDLAYSIRQTRDGGYIVAGMTGSFGGGGADAWVLKLRPDGTPEWQKTYGGNGWDEADSIQQTGDGGYILAGMTESFGAGGGDFWVLKLMPDGSIDSSCDFTGDTNVSGIDSNATILDVDEIVKDSNAKPQTSSATVQDTHVSANILCPTTPVE